LGEGAGRIAEKPDAYDGEKKQERGIVEGNDSPEETEEEPEGPGSLGYRGSVGYRYGGFDGYRGGVGYKYGRIF
jgi:hypothetical protein